jgi:hypothetical protein
MDLWEIVELQKRKIMVAKGIQLRPAWFLARSEWLQDQSKGFGAGATLTTGDAFLPRALM